MQRIDYFNSTLHDYPIIFSLPHSGTYVPDEMKQDLISNVRLTNTDWFLKELYDFLPDMGFTTIQNNVNRYVADPNRQNFFLDTTHNAIPNKNSFDHPLYNVPLSNITIRNRMDDYYLPYHQLLTELITKKLEVFDDIYLVDLHSFYYYPRFEKMSPADFVIGNDYDGTSTSINRLWLTNKLFENKYTVSDNFPFTGGKITKHFGKNEHINSMQVEIRYNKYIEDRDFGEETLTNFDSKLFKETQSNLKKIALDLQQNLISI
ncbi:N-formylglutamate amidohydrolase [Companilactobacillus allii]|uniref:N-formylglutamate amidohydrolase n=1 Tax=Companilactobacillus allii TaxID=1847728 RepID=A0A1P8Q3I5_9LACO|nr:N-formylglutamate amidohydrolase [Companilactobacillus allii]APX72422.1 hypothetical protein BTM29_07600 [Companilactobacillus allii]USQ69517.1 N-formylglutamate amidohydrolase [Companilactobacillus allii]